MKSLVDHIAILVDDLKVAEEWYCTHINCEITFRDAKYIRLKTENANIALIDKKGRSNKTQGWYYRSLCKRPIW